MHGTKCEHKSNKWREEKWFKGINNFLGWNSNCRIHKIHHERYPKDRSNECMWARCGESEIPSSKIPDNRSNKEGEYDTNPKFHGGIGEFFEREELHNTNSYTSSSDNHTKKIKKSSEHNGFFCWKRIGIDNWGHSIGSIMKTIDEFECTNQKQTESCKNISVFHTSKLREK